MTRVNLDPLEQDIEKIRAALLGRVVRGTLIPSPRITLVGIVTHVDTYTDYLIRKGDFVDEYSVNNARPVVTLRRRDFDEPDHRWFDRMTWELAE